MNTIKNFDELLAHLKENNVKKRVAVVWAADEKTPAHVHKHSKPVLSKPFLWVARTS